MNSPVLIVTSALVFTAGNISGEQLAIKITAAKPSARHMYCANVENWKKDAAAGVSPLTRRGHHDRWQVAKKWCN